MAQLFTLAITHLKYHCRRNWKKAYGQEEHRSYTP